MAAISVTPSGNFLKDDGYWSTFLIRVGSPPLMFEVLPSLVSRGIWIPDASYCQQFNNTTDCASSRGVVDGQSGSQGFASNASSSWQDRDWLAEGRPENIPAYARVIESWPGYSRPQMEYGTDEVQFGVGAAAKAPTLLATNPSNDFWLGMVGLRAEVPLPEIDGRGPRSILNQLKLRSYIPSHSFGFTAGAKHRDGSMSVDATMSLTLGGYDRTRRSSPGLTLPLDASSDLPFRVGLRGIEASTSSNQPVTIQDSSESISIAIDSTISEIWLPTSICERLAAEYGLTFEPGTEKYRLDNVTAWPQNPATISFKVATNSSGADEVTLTLPYNAFDPSFHRGLGDNSTAYFPLRRATNASQYLLGRVFLQETYIFVDWDKNVFTLSQASFRPPNTEDLVTYFGNDDDTPTVGVWNSSLPNRAPQTERIGGTFSDGAMGAIAAAAVTLGTGGIIFLFIWCVKRRERLARRTTVVPRTPPELDAACAKAEIGSTEAQVEVEAGRGKDLLREALVLELAGSPVPELPAAEPLALKKARIGT